MNPTRKTDVGRFTRGEPIIQTISQNFWLMFNIMYVYSECQKANKKQMPFIEPLAVQSTLFSDSKTTSVSPADSSTFAPNMSLPVHRWFRYSAGFSAEWVESVIRNSCS